MNYNLYLTGGVKMKKIKIITSFYFTMAVPDIRLGDKYGSIYIHDTKYAHLLRHAPFFKYVVQHDSVHLQPEYIRRTFVFKGMSTLFIESLYKRLFEKQPDGEVETFLLQRAEEDGFISIRNDFGQDYVYVLDAAKYETWVSTAREQVPCSWEIFNRFL